MPATEEALASMGIVVFHHVGDSVAPDRSEAPPDLDPDAWIAPDVAYITSVVTVFGDDTHEPDETVRIRNAPLLDVDGWRKMLAAHGFPSMSAFGLPSAAGGGKP